MAIDYYAFSAQLLNTISVCFISGKFCFVLSTMSLKMSTAISLIITASHKQPELDFVHKEVMELKI